MSNRRAHGPGIRAIRESLGIPHGKFAVAVGISPGYLTNIEKGIKQPSDAVVAAMAQRLGVTVDQITYESRAIVGALLGMVEDPDSKFEDEEAAS